MYGFSRYLSAALLGLITVTPSAVPLADALGRAGRTDRPHRGVPTNQYGLRVVDEQGRRVNYSREELAGLTTVAPVRVPDTPAAPAFDAGATWWYAAFGNGIGASNIVVASNGSKPEIYLGGGTLTFGADQYWHALRFRPITASYEQVFVSPYLASGFSGIARIEVGDVDVNPGDEIVVALQDGRIEVYALADKSWIREIVTGATALRGLSVANLDGDPANEIIVCDATHLYVYLANGSLDWQLTSVGGQDVVAGQMDQDPAIEIAVTDGSIVDAGTHTVQWKRSAGFGLNLEAADIDGDGLQELIAAEEWYLVWAFDVDQRLPKWSIPTAQDIGAVNVLDLDADGGLELLVGDEQWGSIHAYDAATGVKEWEMPNTKYGVTDIAGADVDGDGEIELLWGAGATSEGPDHLFVVDWKTAEIEWTNVQLGGSFVGPEMADLDGDGKPEIVVANAGFDPPLLNGRILVFDATNLKLRAVSPQIVNYTGLHDLRLRDVDGDQRAEILLASDLGRAGLIEIYAFAPSNTFELKWRNGTLPDNAAFYSVEAGDIDGDGTVEIVGGVGRPNASDLFIYVYDLASGEEEWHSPPLGDYSDAITGLQIGDMDLDGVKEIVGMVDEGDIFIFDGSSKSLEAILPHQGTALRLHASVAAPRIVVGDVDGNLTTFRYLQGSYQQTSRLNYVPGRIDGFDRAGGANFWLGHAGTLRLVSSAGATLWQSASYGTVFGARTLSLPSQRFLSAGSYSIVAFAAQ